MDLTTSQVAARLGLSVARVQQFARNGRLPIARTVGRSFLFRARDVEKFAAKERKEGRPRLDRGNGAA